MFRKVLGQVQDLFLIASLLLLPTHGSAQIDLGKLHRQTLDNGLVLLVLEEHSFPSVSVQMLYRVGGRNEPAGQSGIAHFLEHMAFRASKNFPDTDVVSRIYAAGGEWHGYTWIDQTTYFATVPRSELDLLLRIEADRMQQLLIESRWIEPEKGAVLAEMHGYENDRASVLHDAVVYTAFQGHPYRNNVIGWESDIQALQHADVLAFYRQHYQPANAVLAVVGDVRIADVILKVQNLFGDIPPAVATPLPHTIEPAQHGERRLELHGGESASVFEIAYRAPSANDPDFAAMLVFQEWLTGSSGVNFMQDYGTTDARPGSALYGLSGQFRSWFPTAAQEYLFSVQGVAAAGQSQAEAEHAVESVINNLRQGKVSEQAVRSAIDRVLEELGFDLGTHEEAAHQLAYFEGLGALDTWISLPQRVRQVTRSELVSLAQRRLQAWQRTIGWFTPGPSSDQFSDQFPDLSSGSQDGANTAAQGATGAKEPGLAAVPATVKLNTERSQAPALDESLGREARMLDNGLPLLLQDNPVAEIAWISLVIPGNHWQGSAFLSTNTPVWGMSSVELASRPGSLNETLGILLRELDQLKPVPVSDATPPEDLQASFAKLLQADVPQAKKAQLVLVAASGALPAYQVEAMARQLATMPVSAKQQLAPLQLKATDHTVNWQGELAQAQLGYLVLAPLPTDTEYWSWRALQYIVAHDYEGRFGKEAISNQGLAYYIDSRYHSDGQRAWSSLGTGVDPRKFAQLEALMREKLGELETRPPTEDEVLEARNHLAGRILTARQSNAELAAGLAEQWLWYGRLLSVTELSEQINQISRPNVLDLIVPFKQGVVVGIGKGIMPANVTD